MRYGLLTGFLKPFANYGDFVQSLAIEYLYELIGISKNDIYHITMDDLGSYDGEELLLPINTFYTVLIDLESGRPRVSKKIRPVFLSVTLADNDFGRLGGRILTQETLEWLQTNAPIGCRDYYTLKLLRSYNIPAYLQGCLTNALPLRKGKERQRVFFVDCPKEILKFIPDEILADAKAAHNSFCVNGMTDEEIWENARQHYSAFADCARLVVSSRYHVVSPCYAMGIPAIFVKRVCDVQEHDVRLDTLNPNVALHTWKNYSEICWSMGYVPYEEEKQSIIKLASTRLQYNTVDSASVQAVERFYAPRIAKFGQIMETESFYKKKLQSFVLNQYPQPRSGEFYIWGAKPVFYICGKISIVDYILEINPNLTFKGWIDTYKTGNFAGKPIITPRELYLAKGQFVVVAAEAAITDALRLFQDLKISEQQYVICVEQHITDADLKQMREDRF